MNSEGIVIEYTLHFLFKVTNNQYEYKTLLAGLKIAEELGVKCLKVFIDSQLVPNQVTGEYEARDPIMAKYLD